MLMEVLTFHTPNSVSFLARGNLSKVKVIFRSVSQASPKIKKKWDLLSAVCLERHPIITKPMKEIEVRYQEMLKQIEFENSLLSDIELQMKDQANQKQRIMSSDEKFERNVTQTIEDIKEANKQELVKFKFAPRINEMDENKVVSLHRKLDKTLILLMEKQLENANIWVPPQSIRKSTETMIQTAERTVQEFCGNNIKVKFYGNAPIGFYKYEYSEDVKLKGTYGAKIFFFLAKYISGDISSNLKHCWLDREELKQTVHPMLHKSLSQFLLPE